MKPFSFDRPLHNAHNPFNPATPPRLGLQSVFYPFKKRQFFQLSGRICATHTDKAGRCKALQLETDGRIEQIKLAKPLRSRLGHTLHVGSWVSLAGTAKCHPYKGWVKFKAKALTGSSVQPMEPAGRSPFNRSANLPWTRQPAAPPTRPAAAPMPQRAPFTPPAQSTSPDRSFARPTDRSTNRPTDRPTDRSTTGPSNRPVGRILICQKSSCRKRGSDGVCRAINQALADRGLSDRVKVQTTGCLKECSRGPAVVTLPDKTRHTRISPDRIPELIETHFGQLS